MKRRIAFVVALLSAFILLVSVLAVFAQEPTPPYSQRLMPYDPRTATDTVEAEAYLTRSIPGQRPKALSLAQAISQNVELVGQIDGETTAVAVRSGPEGTYAYAGIGPNLVILDVGNPAHLVVVGQVPVLLDVASDIVVSGGSEGTYAYVAAGYGGLQIVDVSDPSRPTKVGSYDTPGWIENVAVSDMYVYIVSEYDGLRIIDVSNPFSPTEVGFYDTPGCAMDVAVSGTYAYVADGGEGLRIINVSDPASPTEVSFYDTPMTAEGVAVSGTYAYVADTYDGLHIIDVSNPFSPTKVSFYDMSEGDDVVVSGGPEGIYAYVTNGAGLQILDISDPSNPIEVGFYYSPGGARDVVTSGMYAYIAGGCSGGLHIIDVSDPTSPTKVGYYDIPSDVYSVAVLGISPGPIYAYVTSLDSCDNDLYIIDVSNPASPTGVGFYDTLGYAYGVAVSGTYAYVADGDYGLRIVDVSDPASPTEVGFYDTLGYAYGVAVSGTHAYIADAYKGLRIIDVSNPVNPTGAGFYDTPGWARRVVVSGGSEGTYAYVADEDYGLRIIDVSNPFSPTEVGFYDTPGYAYDVAVSGTYAYVADGAGLQIVDISDPSNPIEVDFCDTPGDAGGVAVYEGPGGTYAYVADGDDGLRVIDVTNSFRPAEVGFYDMPDYAFGVAVLGAYAYVAVSEPGPKYWPQDFPEGSLMNYDQASVSYSGLMILRFTPPGLYIAGYAVDEKSNPLGGIVISTSLGYTATTWDDGRYMLSHLVTGAYILTPTTPGYVWVPVSRTVTVPPNMTGQDFVGQRVYSVTGQTVDGMGNPIAGVMISTSVGYTVTSNANGQYTLTNLLSGSYTLTPTTSGYFWQPASRHVRVPPDATGQDFAGRAIVKHVTPIGLDAVDYGDILTYTLKLVAPSNRTRVVYDRVPMYATYLSGSLQLSSVTGTLLLPPTLGYDQDTKGIGGPISLTANVPLTVTFSVRVGVSGTVGFSPAIINQAWLCQAVGTALFDCEESNRVISFTYPRMIYIPLVLRNN